MERKMKSVTLEEIYDFCDEHLGQKTDAEFEMIDGLPSMESYQMGLFEGIINGLVWAGIEIKNLEDINSNIREHGNKVKKFPQIH